MGGGGAFGSKQREYHNELENSDITKGFDTRILDELVRVMKKVNIYIWCNKEQINMYLNYFKDFNMDLLVYCKTNPVPTCNNKYLSDIEYLLFFREKGMANMLQNINIMCCQQIRLIRKSIIIQQ